MPIYSSDSDDQTAPPAQSSTLFRRQRTLYSLFGGRRGADILLWKDKTKSALVLAGFTAIWFLFEVAEFHFITLACYILMALMLIRFIWTYAADFINMRPPTIHEIQISEYRLPYIHRRFNSFLAKLHRIASGEDLAYFAVALALLWILSIIGSYSDALNLLYISYLCLATIPVLYERYESEVNYFATQGNRDVKRFYKTLDSKVLSKIPRKSAQEVRFK